MTAPAPVGTVLTVRFQGEGGRTLPPLRAKVEAVAGSQVQASFTTLKGKHWYEWAYLESIAYGGASSWRSDMKKTDREHVTTRKAGGLQPLSASLSRGGQP